MNVDNLTVEDCLEFLVGFQDTTNNYKFVIADSDVSLLRSLAKQVFKGTALTDRQLELSIAKVTNYSDQFQDAGLRIDNAVQGLTRLPLRSIDRSKYIKIVEGQTNDQLWIEIRFPFNKKTILQLEKIKEECSKKLGNIYRYDKHTTHSHRFHLNEVTAFYIIDTFINKEFEIEEKLLSYYKALKEIVDNQDNFIPGIYNLQFKNIIQSSLDYMQSNYGNPNIANLYMFKDRQKLLGLEYLDSNDLIESEKDLSVLTRKIIHRNKANILIKPQSWKIDELAFSLAELDRFPLAILIDETNIPFDHLNLFYQSFNNFVSNKDVSVLFRLDNASNEGKIFNTFVQETNLNNPVAENTKIVYISRSNVPKPLIKENWIPSAVVLCDSFRLTDKVSKFTLNSDLIIHYDNQPSAMFKYNRTTYGYNDALEEL